MKTSMTINGVVLNIEVENNNINVSATKGDQVIYNTTIPTENVVSDQLDVEQTDFTTVDNFETPTDISDVQADIQPIGGSTEIPDELTSSEIMVGDDNIEDVPDAIDNEGEGDDSLEEEPLADIPTEEGVEDTTEEDGESDEDILSKYMGESQYLSFDAFIKLRNKNNQ